MPKIYYHVVTNKPMKVAADQVIDEVVDVGTIA